MTVDVRIPDKINPGATTNVHVASNDLFRHGDDINRFETVPCVTLNWSLLREKIPYNFELLVIDVNGGEPGILEGINLKIWKPKMIIIATHKGHKTWDFNVRKIAGKLAPWYKEIFHDHVNSIYIRRELI